MFASRMLSRFRKSEHPCGFQATIGLHLSQRIVHTAKGLAHIELGLLCFCSRRFLVYLCIECAGIAAICNSALHILQPICSLLKFPSSASKRDIPIRCINGDVSISLPRADIPHGAGLPKQPRKVLALCVRTVRRIELRHRFQAGHRAHAALDTFRQPGSHCVQARSHRGAASHPPTPDRRHLLDHSVSKLLWVNQRFRVSEFHCAAAN